MKFGEDELYIEGTDLMSVSKIIELMIVEDKVINQIKATTHV